MLAHLISTGFELGAAAIVAAASAALPPTMPARVTEERHGAFFIRNVSCPAPADRATVQLGRNVHIDRIVLETREAASCR